MVATVNLLPCCLELTVINVIFTVECAAADMSLCLILIIVTRFFWTVEGLNMRNITFAKQYLGHEGKLNMIYNTYKKSYQVYLFVMVIK